MKKLVLFVIVALVSVSVFAQKGKKTQTIVGANLRFEITGAQDTMTYLVFHFRDKLMLKDSARATKSGVFIFKSDRESSYWWNSRIAIIGIVGIIRINSNPIDI